MRATHCLIPTLFVLFAEMSPAQRTSHAFELRSYAGIQGFSWKEFDVAGNELLNENGPRFSFALQPRFSFGAKKEIYTELSLEYTSGLVDYNGSTQDLLTGRLERHSTSTQYTGARINLDFAYDGCVSEAFTLVPSLGVGTEFWNRDLGDGDAMGYDEKYSVFQIRLGFQGVVALTKSVQVHSGFIVGFPVSITETIDRFPRVNPAVTGIGLEPGINPSFTAQIGGNMDIFFAVVYFETWTLSKSHFVKGLYQPESTRTQLGLRIGYILAGQ